MALSQAQLENPGIEEPNDADNSPPDNPNAQGTPAVATPAATPPVDDLDRQLAEAMAAVEAERLAALAAPAAAAPAAAPASPEAPATPATPRPATTPTMVPLAVAKAERSARQEAEQRAAYWQGQAEARGSTQAAPAAPVVPEPTPQERLAAIGTERLNLAEQYDQGAIKTREWEERRIALEHETWNIQNALQPQAPQVNIAAAVWEEQETARIEGAYPVLKAMTQADLMPLVEVARRQAQREGVPIEENSRGTVELRERVARLATTMYGGVPPASQQPAAIPGAHPNAAAAALAVSHPANVSQIGAASVAGALTDEQALAQMAKMNETEQIAFMDRNPLLVNRALNRSR